MSEREAFSRWVDVTTEAWTTDERKGGTPRMAEVSLCAGIVVDARGTSVRIEAGGAGNTTTIYLWPDEERALYEALRVRFDAGHREAVQKAALAKLTALEQQVLREAFGPMEAAAARAEPSGEKAPKRKAMPAR